MTDQLKAGDVVKLKSGGPPMTIVGPAPRGGFICTWFDEKKVLQRAAFETAVLMAWNESAPPGPRIV